MSAAILTARDLTVGYPRPHRALLRKLALSARGGELVCVIGANGAGKSTLLRTLIGMQAPLSGEVYIDDRPLAALTSNERAMSIAVVLTERVEADGLSAWELVALGRTPYTDWAGRLHRADRAAVDRAIDAVGARSLASRRVNTLSDGERQKILIARALAQEPRLLVLDEPTAFLDMPRRFEIAALLRRLAIENGCAVVMSTHDLDLALRLADQVWLLGGTPTRLQVGAPEDLVLAGAFTAMFEGVGALFDPGSGGFAPAFTPRHDGRRISLYANDPAARLWARRALERAGFAITSEPTASTWARVTRDGEGWSITRPTHDTAPPTICASLADVIEVLREV